MTIEQDVFKRARIDFGLLVAYGFQKEGKSWHFIQTFMNGDFRAVIEVNEDGTVSGNVYEGSSDELYLPLRVESMSAGFVGQVRAEYMKVLEDIKQNCCRLSYFITPQANRLTEKINHKYRDIPDFPWEKFSGYGVFKNPESGKWYAFIGDLDKNKLDHTQSGKTEIINLKADADKIPALLKRKGFYPAYHMNKKNWITITLDESVADDEIMFLIDESHQFTEPKKKAGQKSKKA